jgi:hypothetical protein
VHDSLAQRGIVTGRGTKWELAEKVGRRHGSSWRKSLLRHFGMLRAAFRGRHRRSSGARPVKRRGSVRTTSTRAGPDPPGDEPGGAGQPDVVPIAAPFTSPFGRVNGAMRRFLRERGLS